MKFLHSILLAVILACSTVSAHANTARSGADQELVDLFFAAAKTGNQEVIDEFLKYGFPVDVRNVDGYTPLMMATYYGHQEIVTRLLKQGADRCLRDNKGNTALMGAIFKLEWSIAKQLRQIDCDSQAKSIGQKTVAEFAEVIGQTQKLQELIKTSQ